MRKLREEQKKAKEAKAKPAAVDEFPITPSSSLPPVGKAGMLAMDLPTIGSRKGQFEVNEEAKKQARLAMMKLDDIIDMDAGKVEEDSRSMMEIMRAKNAAADKNLEEKK